MRSRLANEAIPGRQNFVATVDEEGPRALSRDEHLARFAYAGSLYSSGRINAIHYSPSMAPSSFEYSKPWHDDDVACPHCKQSIEPGDNVHWYDGVLWHTKPCP